MGRLNSIVIAGIPACGKTVFLSVLALKYQKYLYPKNLESQEFYDEAEHLLESEWPAPTDPLKKGTTMLWELAVSQNKYLLMANDAAGEAWATFVAENQDPNMSPEEPWQGIKNTIREHLQPQVSTELESIENQFKSAVCVCLLIDLTEDLDKGINKDQRRFVIATMNYLQKIGRSKCPLALVVTKCKTYGNTNWENVLQDNYGAMLQQHWEGSWPIIRTDAVADTISDENNNLLPAPNFSSVGMGVNEGEFLFYIDHLAKHAILVKTLRKIILAGSICVVSAIVYYCLNRLLGILLFVCGGILFCFWNKNN